MSNATIYSMDGETIADGLQSSIRCDAAIQTARRVAADRGASVVVEDYGSGEVYRVTPAGYRWRAPKSWCAADAMRRAQA